MNELEKNDLNKNWKLKLITRIFGFGTELSVNFPRLPTTSRIGNSIIVVSKDSTMADVLPTIAGQPFEKTSFFYTKNGGFRVFFWNFHPETLEKRSNLTCAYFFRWVEKNHQLVYLFHPFRL